ncbi:MAG TPA: DUF445 family protein [Desulfohalobiaceae bacterium]|nr:DUF445 family protein [Desulfohalobiaceae bacterium]
MEILKIVISPFICATIGWFTNFLAVKMLFHPKEPIKFLWWTIQGIFPKRQKALAINLGELIERELISHEDIQKVIQDPEFLSKFESMIHEYISNFLENKLTSFNPMISMFLTDEIKQKIQEILSEEIKQLIPEIIQKTSDELENKLDFSHIVRQKVEAFSMDKLEDILFSIMSKEFRFIEFVGAVLGFLIGIFQSIFHLTG